MPRDLADYYAHPEGDIITGMVGLGLISEEQIPELEALLIRWQNLPYWDEEGLSAFWSDLEQEHGSIITAALHAAISWEVSGVGVGEHGWHVSRAFFEGMQHAVELMKLTTQSA